MHDIATIRREPEAFDAALARRGAEPVTARLLDLDTRRRAVLTELQDAQNRRNAASKAIGQAMGSGNTEEADRLKAEVLGVPQDASGADIKHAYLDLAMKYHPDKVRATEALGEAQRRFQVIANAWETLR